MHGNRNPGGSIRLVCRRTNARTTNRTAPLPTGAARVARRPGQVMHGVPCKDGRQSIAPLRKSARLIRSVCRRHIFLFSPANAADEPPDNKTSECTETVLRAARSAWFAGELMLARQTVLRRYQ